MSIKSRIVKVAEKILDEVVSDIQEKEVTSAIDVGTEEGLKKYIEQHPDYREDTVFIVNGVERKAPPKQKKNKSEDDEIKMTDEQKKLHEMSNSDDEKIRIEVAKSDNIHLATLYKLTDDSSDSVRRYVAGNHNANEEILDKLSKDKSSYVRRTVASNSNVPKKILDNLANDSNYDVLGQLAWNKNTDPKTIEKIAEKAFAEKENETIEENLDRVFLKKDLAYGVNTPVEILEKLCVGGDASFETYLMLQKRPPEIRKRILEKFVEVGDEKMREIAIRDLNKMKK